MVQQAPAPEDAALHGRRGSPTGRAPEHHLAGSDYLEASDLGRGPRLDAWAITYLGAEDTPFHRAAGRAWLISAVARALRPGCKADCALILEGPQGMFKSTALRTLASEPWFFDGLRDFNGKDASRLCAASGSSSFPSSPPCIAPTSRRSSPTSRARPNATGRAYGRNEAIEPRRCVFAGSTNGKRYLRDTTGNRRFWPIPVGFIDIPALKRDRNQLWAEAVVRFRAGEQWWLDAAMEEVAATIVAERTEETRGSRRSRIISSASPRRRRGTAWQRSASFPRTRRRRWRCGPAR